MWKYLDNVKLFFLFIFNVLTRPIFRVNWLINIQTPSSWWRHKMETFSALLVICAGNSPVTPHKGQWRVASMISLSCAWINGWVNNTEAGDLRRHRAHYVITEMYGMWRPNWWLQTLYRISCFKSYNDPVFVCLSFITISCHKTNIYQMCHSYEFWDILKTKG